MNGAHDLGGKHGLGAISPENEQEEPVFHAEWERRVFALTLASGMLGQWNIDESRYARERQHPVTYLNNSYYENWLAGLETLLGEKQLLNDDAQNTLRVPKADDAQKILSKGGPTLMADSSEPRFNTGQRVRVRKIQHSGHTRAPSYVQGACGEIAAHYGTHIFADAHARGEILGEHLYSVKFDASELFGEEVQSTEVFVDLWEPYLEHLAP